MIQQLEDVSMSQPGDKLLTGGNYPLYWEPDLECSSNFRVCPGDMKGLKGSFGLDAPSRHSHREQLALQQPRLGCLLPIRFRIWPS